MSRLFTLSLAGLSLTLLTQGVLARAEVESDVTDLSTQERTELTDFFTNLDANGNSSEAASENAEASVSPNVNRSPAVLGPATDEPVDYGSNDPMREARAQGAVIPAASDEIDLSTAPTYTSASDTL